MHIPAIDILTRPAVTKAPPAHAAPAERGFSDMMRDPASADRSRRDSAPAARPERSAKPAADRKPAAEDPASADPAAPDGTTEPDATTAASDGAADSPADGATDGGIAVAADSDIDPEPEAEAPQGEGDLTVAALLARGAPDHAAALERSAMVSAVPGIATDGGSATPAAAPANSGQNRPSAGQPARLTGGPAAGQAASQPDATGEVLPPQTGPVASARVEPAAPVPTATTSASEPPAAGAPQALENTAATIAGRGETPVVPIRPEPAASGQEEAAEAPVRLTELPAGQTRGGSGRSAGDPSPSTTAAAKTPASAGRPDVTATALGVNGGEQPTVETTQAGPQTDPVAAATSTQAARPPAAPPASVPAATPGAAAAAAEQVVVQLRRAVEAGTDRLTVQMKPASLGRVEIQMEVGFDGRVQAVISTDRPETLYLLQRDARTLAAALNEAGLQADSGSLSFNLRGGSGDQAAHDGGDHADGGSDGAAGGVDAVDDDRPAATLMLGAGRVDIRV